MEMLKNTRIADLLPAGDFYIDPWRPCGPGAGDPRHIPISAVGMKRYLAAEGTAPVMRHRLGEIDVETVRYERCE